MCLKFYNDLSCEGNIEGKIVLTLLFAQRMPQHRDVYEVFHLYRV